MAYVWTDYDENKKYKIASHNFIPGVEVANSKSKEIDVNVLPRLFPYLFPIGAIVDSDKIIKISKENESVESDDRIEFLFQRLVEKYETNPFYQQLFNLLIHAYAQMDRKRSMQLIDVLIDMYRERIMNNAYGNKAVDVFSRCSAAQQHTILRFLVKSRLSNGRHNYYGEVLSHIFHDINIYFEKNTKLVHIYIDVDKDDVIDDSSINNEELLSLVDFFFKDIAIDTRVMWRGELFAVIDIPEMMVIDKMGII